MGDTLKCRDLTFTGIYLHLLGFVKKDI